MRNFTLRSLILFALIISGISCSDDDDDGCVHCTAVCKGDDSSTLNYCGGEIDNAEEEFRAANPDCIVECTYHNE